MLSLALLCLLASSALAHEDVHSRIAGFGVFGYYVAAPLQQQIPVPVVRPNVVPIVVHKGVPVAGYNAVPVAGYNVVPVAGPKAPGLSYPVFVDGSQFHENSCRYWCLTPEKYFYCCEESYEPESFVGQDKAGFCPVARKNCPLTSTMSAPPKKCSNDHSCLGLDKCCYDRCFSRHVCKPLRGPYPGASPRVSAKGANVPL